MYSRMKNNDSEPFPTPSLSFDTETALGHPQTSYSESCCTGDGCCSDVIDSVRGGAKVGAIVGAGVSTPPTLCLGVACGLLLCGAACASLVSCLLCACGGGGSISSLDCYLGDAKHCGDGIAQCPIYTAGGIGALLGGCCGFFATPIAKCAADKGQPVCARINEKSLEECFSTGSCGLIPSSAPRSQSMN